MAVHKIDTAGQSNIPVPHMVQTQVYGISVEVCVPVGTTAVLSQIRATAAAAAAITHASIHCIKAQLIAWSPLPSPRGVYVIGCGLYSGYYNTRLLGLLGIGASVAIRPGQFKNTTLGLILAIKGYSIVFTIKK